MKITIKKIYITFFLFILLFNQHNVLAKNSKIQYKSENISNYFLGVISSNQDFSEEAFQYLKKVQSLKDRHYKFNIEFIRTLVLLNKFDKALDFSKDIWEENELFFEADLLLGIDSFLNEDHKNAEKYFKRLNEISKYNIFFKDFIGNVLLSWSKASQNNKKESLEYIKKIPTPYRHLKKIQHTFLQCYFDDDTETAFQQLTTNEEYNFSRYNFFLANYLLHKNKTTKAKMVINNSLKAYNSNLLLKQTQKFLEYNKEEKIIDFFNCENPKDSIAEFFYIISNLYASEQNYQLSNFYLNISLFFNKDFLPNRALLAENYYYQNHFLLSKKVFNSLKNIGEVYSWHASKNIATILSEEEGEKFSINSLENEFKLITKPNFNHFYELANFYKTNQYFKESIKYYSLALKELEDGHFLIPKILDRRGTSYERLGDWKNAEKDLLKSLEIIPDQPHVLNYLAYSWIDKGINLDEGLEMLKKATKLKKNDGYIIDSLGWAYYAKKDYVKAEKYLQQAVELLPTDPVINDHYADTLWMLNKNIQARYIWDYVLKLKDTEKDLKDKINKKLIFGIIKKI